MTFTAQLRNHNSRKEMLIFPPSSDTSWSAELRNKYKTFRTRNRKTQLASSIVII